MTNIEDWRQQGQYHRYQSHRIFFRDSLVTQHRNERANTNDSDESKLARQPVLVLIHGFPTSSWDYHHVWTPLESHFRLITLDMLGYGLSDKPFNHRYSILTQANIIQSLLKELGVTQFNILAHDYGDSVAQELLARDLENDSALIQSVILLNGGLFIEAQRPVLLQKLLLSPIGPIVARFIRYRKFKKNFDRICAKPLPDEELATYWQLIVNNQGIRVMPKIIQYIKERKRYRSRWVASLSEAQCPLKFVNGIEDPVSGQLMVDRYRQLVPNGEVKALKGVGHYPQAEAPEIVLKQAFEFWRSHQVL